MKISNKNRKAIVNFGIIAMIASLMLLPLGASLFPNGFTDKFVITNSNAANLTSAGAHAAAITAAGVMPGGDWMSFLFNNNDTRNQQASTITSSNVNTLHQAWFLKTGSSVTGQPIVLNGTMYFADWNGNVWAASASTGAVKWKVNLKNSISSTVAVSNGLVYVAQGPAGPPKVYALSQSDGHVVWVHAFNCSSCTMKAIWASPEVYNNILYIGTSSTDAQGENNASLHGKLYALNAATGAKLWSLTTAGTAGGAAVWGSVVYDPLLKSIYVGTGNSFSKFGTNLYSYSILSVNATSGKVNWFYQVYKNLTVGDDKDFGSSPNLFTAKIGGSLHQAVGIPSKNGNYYIVDRKTGALLETILPTAAKAGAVGVASYYYINGNASNPEIYVPEYTNGPGGFTNSSICCGHLEAIRPSTGKVLWNFTTPSNLVVSSLLIPGAVIVADERGDVYALGLSNHTVLWQTKLVAPIYGSPTVAEGHLYVPTAFNSNNATEGIYAFVANTITNTTTTTTTVSTTSVPTTSVTTTIGGGKNTGLGTPVVTPTTPPANTAFTISCPANNNTYDCIDAYANGFSNRCTWTNWAGNNAVFSCAGLPTGNYVAECQAITGTPSNCLAAITSANYTVS